MTLIIGWICMFITFFVYTLARDMDKKNRDQRGKWENRLQRGLTLFILAVFGGLAGSVGLATYTHFFGG